MRTYLLGITLLLASPALLGSTIYKYTDENGVVTYTDERVQGAQVFLFRDRMVENNDRQVYVTTRKHAGGDTLMIKNDLYVPVEIELAITSAEHVLGAPAKPVRWVLPPRGNIRLLTLAPDGKGTPRYQHKLQYALGDPRAEHHPQAYPLPWRGGPFRMTQGPGGRYSHSGPKGRYAVDIAMPVGTPIVAARGGLVVKTENQQSGRGTNPAGNFVRLLHDDGTMGVYLHLKQGSVSVREGQRVRAGELLALSGNTGNSTGPHLHFVVQKNVGLSTVSIPFEFSQPVDSLPNFAVGGER
ncbi:Murein DD-endopeptidase MepM and murein hydrolase activator NlpD, contain LysM domain [Halopseudomonas litoralis]|uniref:Murein DD-endopeptidase MepM and murein hydrolase activator NlpD, contain LysM domain n=1 Tax=Halopseudomonas litoralis TaxID=797277 RepID=A0A1H1WHD5_9GAMM|nr:M23 family metallopeptidase [Halopseudomonas litoralis]SDS96523.1 Murein DD-endopeptidase MepM and murein hydrolase activator NlpD, contain LysM domain [Halopseudomonas litoralis]